MTNAATSIQPPPPQLVSIQKLVAQKLASTPLDTLMTATGKDDTQTCRIRSNQLAANVDTVVKLLFVAGLKCVPLDRVCVERETYQAMAHIAAKAMADPATAQKLTWGDEQ